TAGGIDGVRAIVGDGYIGPGESALRRAQRVHGVKRVIHSGDIEVHRCRSDVATVAVLELGGACLSRVGIYTTVDGTWATESNLLLPSRGRTVVDVAHADIAINGHIGDRYISLVSRVAPFVKDGVLGRI